ncbi:DUF2188 domain-containing protein [Aurantivibrio plasticivorans]
MDNYYINKKGDNWQLVKQGASRATLKGQTKQEVVKQTSEYMANKVGSVKIQKQNGQFQEERTYQRKNDPRSTKG